MNELELFKQSINIVLVAQDFGYIVDTKKTTKQTIILKQNDTIIVSKKNGYYIYFNPDDPQDKGTIIDFIQKRTNQNLGQIRKTLRQYLNNPTPTIIQPIQTSNANNNKDFDKIWNQLNNKHNNINILNNATIRGISKETLESTQNLVFVNNNFYFPIFSEIGVCGIYKTCNKLKEKRFLKGSQKGVWVDKKLNTNIDKIVITESPIDSLSAIELQKQKHRNINNTLHIATLGRMGNVAKETLLTIFNYLQQQKIELFIATDNDGAGDDIANEITELAKKVDLNNIKRVKFADFKDVNDYLLNGQ